MKKDQREMLRVDLLTTQLVYALQDRLSSGDKLASKSDVYRTAVYRMAKDLIDEDEFNKLVLAFNDIEKL